MTFTEKKFAVSKFAFVLKLMIVIIEVANTYPKDSQYVVAVAIVVVVVVVVFGGFKKLS